MECIRDKMLRFRTGRNLIVSATVFIFCILLSGYIYYNYQDESYRELFVLPIIYGLCFFCVFRKYFFTPSRLFHLVFMVLSGLRYVILPVAIVTTGYYGGRSVVPPTRTSFQIGFYLMCIELVAASIFIIYLESKIVKTKVQNHSKGSLTYPKHLFIYGIFTVVVILLMMLQPICLKAINIILPNAQFQPEELGMMRQIIILAFIVLKQLGCILMIGKFKRLYDKTGLIRYVIFSSIMLCLNVFIYTGDNRSDFLLMGMASVVIFCIAFKKYTKQAIIIGTMIIILIVGAISSGRSIQSASQGANKLLDLTEMMQVYLGGPYNVAMAVDTSVYYPEGRTLANLLYDFGRPTLGLNMILKNLPLEYSNVFYNSRIYFSDHRAQIIPMIGEGYYFLGPIFAPVITLIFIKIAYVLESRMLYARRIELVYFFSLTSIRLGFLMGQNAMIQMNDLSFNLFLPVILLWLNDKVVWKRGHVINNQTNYIKKQ